ncbi:helix-turn-helix transcriptional regulator [Kitasatospora sp. RB6PN24]|uniref:helix-turn-helix domain-containing protein n=1 Tax=Kitasatospora humi TaxID=2893891 RepID=UPI001E5CF29E|nr:helix-turn-helix transcriptional regulator [Kitasatospora humi]MCC9307595.1 helix-turn-helix transcriptional regulator [Kitasatospora humi]
MSTNAENPATWRYCGNQVKLWRERSGVSREQLAAEANYDLETVKSMEQGRRRPSVRLLQAAETLCDARGLLLAAVDYLQPERIPRRTREYFALEHDAISVHTYEPLLIPGLLQTPEYARALMDSHCPPVSDELVDERVAARLKRQEKLTRTPPALLGFILYAPALQTLVGGPTTMKKQLHHLLEVGELRNVSIQVLPAGRGAYFALTGAFNLLETPDHRRYGYAEGQESGNLYSDAEKVSNLSQRHGVIRMQALSTEESARFISAMADEL